MQPKSKTTQPQASSPPSGGAPKDWPADITYLRAPSYSKKLAKDALEVLVMSKADLSPGEQLLRSIGPYTNIKITKVASPSHPANGQRGLFASQHLAPDSFILPYLGYVHGKTDTDETSDYDLSLDRDHGVGVDASLMGNEARFINDYRGITTAPNAEFRDIYADIGNGKAEKRMAVFVLSAGKSGKRAKGIPMGSEILVSYGKGFWAERQKSLQQE